jgi:7-keto-8-aminopelargonate synthetase-like enzyme
MTVPPHEAPPEEDDLDEDELLHLRPPSTGPFVDLEVPEVEVRVRGVTIAQIPKAALSGHPGQFVNAKGPDLLARTAEYFEWYQARAAAGLWPYGRRYEGRIGAAARLRTEDGALAEGMNYAAHDYLSLAAHPAVKEAVHKALRDFGPLAGGASFLTGSTTLTRTLEEEVAALTGLDHVLLFTSGWGAGFSAITALVRDTDHVILDVYASAGLQQGAAAATPKISRFRHCDNASAERHIKKAREADAHAGILVVTETLFPMDSDGPNLAGLQEICSAHGATLLVDCAHDLGAMGPGGKGRLGAESMVGKVDLVVGCFSKTFATGGGFLAARHERVRQFVRAFGGPHSFSTGLSPVQTAIALASMRVSAGPEGDERRRRLMAAATSLRGELGKRGLSCLGEPSPLVPVMIGDEDVARIATSVVSDRGLLLNLAEYPSVPVGRARFRLQCQAQHTPEQASRAARILDETLRATRASCGKAG